MNRIDAILLLVLAFYAFLGYRRGFLAVALDWLGLAAALTAAFWLYPALGTWIAGRYKLDPGVASVLAFVALLLGVRLAWSLVVWLVWRRIPRVLRQSSLNRVAGIVPGLLQGTVMAALALVALAALPLPVVPRAKIASSPLGSTLLRWGTQFQAGVLERMGSTLHDLLAFRSVTLKEDERLDLPFKTTQAEPDPKAEVAMLHLVNVERQQRGLTLLKMDERLRQVARQHSRDMLARGYFCHNDPEGHTPFDRLRAAGIRYHTAGENLAFAPTVSVAHQGLMKSPGHRANILNPAFRRAGIGAMRAAPYGLMFSQELTD